MIEIKITGNDAAETLQQLKELAGSVWGDGKVYPTLQAAIDSIPKKVDAPVSRQVKAPETTLLNGEEVPAITLADPPIEKPDPTPTPAKAAIADTHPMTEGEVSPMELTELRAIVTKAVQAGKKVKDLLDSTNYSSVAEIPAEQRRDFAAAVEAL